MRQLLWKEWHEQSWKLAFGCIVLSAIAVIGLHSRMTPDAILIEWICVLGATMLPILSSTGLVPAERAEGSFESLLAMPIKPWRILAAKTVMGLLLCAGPLVVVAIVSVLMAGGRETRSGDIFEQYGRTTLTTVSLFVWMMVLTIRLPSEARAALLAVGLLILWAIASGAMAFSSLHANVFAVSPAVFLVPKIPVLSETASAVNAVSDRMLYQHTGRAGLDLDAAPLASSPPLLVSLIVQLVVLGLLWMLSVRMFTRPIEGRS